MRHYSLAEARALLPEVAAVVKELHTVYVEVRAIQAAQAAAARGVTADGHLLDDPWADEDDAEIVNALMERLQSGSSRLEEWDIELKDAERGLIDFYHERAGELVFLCWQLGEPNLAWWHTLEGGFAARQPL